MGGARGCECSTGQTSRCTCNRPDKQVCVWGSRLTALQAGQTGNTLVWGVRAAVLCVGHGAVCSAAGALHLQANCVGHGAELSVDGSILCRDRHLHPVLPLLLMCPHEEPIANTMQLHALSTSYSCGVTACAVRIILLCLQQELLVNTVQLHALSTSYSCGVTACAVCIILLCLQQELLKELIETVCGCMRSPPQHVVQFYRLYICVILLCLQKEMLANTVRLHALSTSYICGVLPNLK
eukprot:598970-Pelagomonas_calceolata.AAC.3